MVRERNFVLDFFKHVADFLRILTPSVLSLRCSYFVGQRQFAQRRGCKVKWHPLSILYLFIDVNVCSQSTGFVYNICKSVWPSQRWKKYRDFNSVQLVVLLNSFSHSRVFLSMFVYWLTSVFNHLCHPLILYWKFIFIYFIFCSYKFVYSIG